MNLLDIILTDGWALIIGIAAALLLLGLFSSNKNLQKEKNNYSKRIMEIENQLQIDKNETISKLKEQTLVFQKREAESKVYHQNWALAEFERFKKSEIERIQREADNQAIKAANVALQKWKIESEAAIRQDAINRSYSVNLGKITEHLVPYHQSFLSQFNPKDARFIGSPIDLIVFDGYADKREEIQVYLVEIKTGNSKLTEIQRKIKQSVLNGNIRWAEINPAINNQTLTLTSATKDATIKQIASSSDEDEDTAKLIAAVEFRDGETRDALIDRIANAIEGIGPLVDEEGYTLKTAIAKRINDVQLTFKNVADEEFFINTVIKSFE